MNDVKKELKKDIISRLNVCDDAEKLAIILAFLDETAESTKNQSDCK